MDRITVKMRSSAVFAAIARLSAESPLGYIPRLVLAREMSMSAQDTMEVVNYLKERGDVQIGPTINDFWVRPAQGGADE